MCSAFKKGNGSLFVGLCIGRAASKRRESAVWTIRYRHGLGCIDRSLVRHRRSIVGKFLHCLKGFWTWSVVLVRSGYCEGNSSAVWEKSLGGGLIG